MIYFSTTNLNREYIKIYIINYDVSHSIKTFFSL